MDKENIERWYLHECRKAGTSASSSEVPFQQKMAAFALLLSVPVGLSGCSADPIPNPQTSVTKSESASAPSDSASRPLTAFDECEWEQDVNGIDIDCGNSDSEWYKSHGYTNKHSYVKTTSPFYSRMRGGSGPDVSKAKPPTPSAYQKKNEPRPASASVPKPAPSSSAVSTPGKTTAPSSLSPVSSARAGGVGSGGMSSGGFSSGG